MSPIHEVLIYSDRPHLPWRHLPWLLSDPLLRSEARFRPEVKVAPAQEGRPCPDLSTPAIAPYGLVLVPYPHQVKDEYVPDLLRYLDDGGGLLLVQPRFESSAFPAALAGKTGVTCSGWEQGSPDYSFSSVTDHPGARILGLPEGSSAYPHANYSPYPVFAVDERAVLTRTGAGHPDFLVSPKARAAIVATDVFNDLEAYEKSGPSYYTYRQNIGYLLVNAVRRLFGYGFANQPIPKHLQRWSDLFYAFAAGRQYVSSAQNSLPGRLSPEELSLKLEDADALVDQAAESLLRGEVAAGQRHFDTAVKILSAAMAEMTPVDRRVFRGWQANGLHDRHGQLVGYAQTEWVDLLLQWMAMQIDWLKRTGSKRVYDISAMTWEIIGKYYPAEAQAVGKATKDGLLEAVSGLYTQANLPLLSGESNVRQFAYGHRTLHRVLGTAVETFLQPFDSFNFHPQLPQLLTGFGCRFAVLRCVEHLGIISPVAADKIRWRGLDGSEVEAVPTYEGLPSPHHPEYWFEPSLLARAEELGRQSILLGYSFDSNLEFPAEKEFTLLDGIAPVTGRWTTASEFFTTTPAASQSVFFGVDGLWARYLEVWSSFGCLNEAYGWNRSVESLILAAEKFSAVALALDDAPDDRSQTTQSRLEESWKNLLATQDRMLFGSVNYDEQTPSTTLAPDMAKAGRHYYGYHLGRQSQQEKRLTMGMENLQEMLTANYAGPMYPISRYDMVKERLSLSRQTAGQILDEALRYLSEGIRPRTQGGLVPVVVFNQLGWWKTDVATVAKEFPEGALRGFVLTDGGEEVPHQIVALERHEDGSVRRVELVFVARVPPLGYKSYFLTPIGPEER
ncbi:MAG: hypothetical protein LBH76_03235 [Propionibacteriaceae bacterium]|jgi:hypothetical protein|nr:hypothetical protein [Propionibacteriaceae bacterium]